MDTAKRMGWKVKAVVTAMLGIVAIVSGIWLYGFVFVPVRHTVASTAYYAVPREIVWDLISDFSGYPAWRSDLDSVSIKGTVEWVEYPKAEHPLSLKMIQRDAPFEMTVVTNDPELPFTGSWKYKLVLQEGGTRVLVIETGNIPNPLIRTAWKLFVSPAETMHLYLRDLGKAIGEEVVVSDVQ